jgi:hypothetical protein
MALNTLKITPEAAEPRNLSEQRAQIIIHILQRAYQHLLEEPRYVVKDDQVVAEMGIKGRTDVIGIHVTEKTHRIWGIKGVLATAVREAVNEELQGTTGEEISEAISDELSGLEE